MYFKKIFDIYILKKSEICVLTNYIISLRMPMINNIFFNQKNVSYKRESHSDVYRFCTFLNVTTN